MGIHCKSTKLIVASIDIGTTHSGYAFSMRNDWGKVYTSKWFGGSLVSSKAPTCLLLKDDFTKSYFGYEAEDRYADLTSDENHHNYYFFQRFKMIIHGESDAQHKRCYDITGKTLEAGHVFTRYIKCLKDSMFQNVESVFPGIRDDDIEYVLTVPAIFGENSKMFLIEASVKAGIKMENLTIALEPEAASIYCQYLKFAKEDTSSPALGVVKAGTKYMVVDLGGGTADITVHKKCEDNTLEEVLVSGWPSGGKAVDDQFIKFLSELVGRDAWYNFKMECIEEYLEITRSFETKKLTINPDKSGNIRIPMPLELTSLTTKSHRVKSIKDVIEKNDAYRNNVNFSVGKLVIDNNFLRTFFKETIDQIVGHIDVLFQKSETRDVKTIIMVGGFSECSLVQDAIKKHFGDVSIIVPEEAGLAVLKGAVFFGHIPDAISQRSAR